MIKIVQEDLPPFPDMISDELKDFLTKCFQKDPYKRIDAKSLLQHPWLSKYDSSYF
jgi:serine/threonine protein kinase